MTLLVKKGIWRDDFIDVPRKVADELMAADPSIVEAGFPQQQQAAPAQQQPAQPPRMSFDQLAPYAQRAITMRPRGVAPNPNMELDMDTERNNAQADQLKSYTNNLKSQQKLQQAQTALSAAQNPAPALPQQQAQPLAPEQQPAEPMQPGIPKTASDSFVCNTSERTPKGQFPKGRRSGKTAVERMRELMGGEQGRPFSVSKQPAK